MLYRKPKASADSTEHSARRLAHRISHIQVPDSGLPTVGSRRKQRVLALSVRTAESVSNVFEYIVCEWKIYKQKIS